MVDIHKMEGYSGAEEKGGGLHRVGLHMDQCLVNLMAYTCPISCLN